MIGPKKRGTIRRELQQPRRNRLLDVGWYPDGDVEVGQFRLVVYEGDFDGQLLHEFCTRNRRSLVAEIERVLGAVNREEL